MSKSKATIVRANNTYQVFGDVGIADNLPISVLEVKFDGKGNIWLEDTGEISLPEKIYSNDKDFISHVLKSYENAETSLGVLLSGEKGLGKSFTANVLSKKVNLPVVKITQAVPKNIDLFGLLSRLTDEYVLFIDEFGKLFSSFGRDEDSNPATHITQQDFLQFLDGGSLVSKKLVIFTTNEQVSPFLLNRPSRIRYHRIYDQLADEVIKEIIDDILINQDFKADLLAEVNKEKVNLDVLIKIIQEVNLHNTPYSKFKKFFNFDNHTKRFFTVKLANGTIMQTGMEIQVPFTKGQRVGYDAEYQNYYYVETIEQTNGMYKIRAEQHSRKGNADISKGIELILEESFRELTY